MSSNAETDQEKLAAEAKKARREAFAARLAEALADPNAQPLPASGGGAAPPADSDDDEQAPPPQREPRSKEQVDEILHINTKDEEIDLSNLRIFGFPEVELASFVNCRSLLLRKNLIHYLVIDEFPAHLRAQLEEFDMFDNKIRHIGDFFGTAPCAWGALRKLDLSYNQIKTIEGLDHLAGTLEELYLVENRIKVIQGLDALVNLRLLELGGNKIRELGDGLRQLRSLEQLWLGKNKIGELKDCLNQLHNLKRVSLQANRMIKISPENFPAGANPHLEELYVSENGLTVIENLEHLPALTILDMSMNKISRINEAVVNKANMPLLEEFWLTDGSIDDWHEVTKLRCFEATLHTVYLERNPIEQDKRYRDKVYMELPFVRQIDSWPVVNKGNLEADRAIHRR